MRQPALRKGEVGFAARILFLRFPETTIRMRTFSVTPDDEGLRIDRYIANMIPEISRSQLQHMIVNGTILVNGATIPKRTPVKTGDRVTVDSQAIDRISHAVLIPQSIPLDIIYEDSHFVAINKQAGLVVHPGSGNRSGTLVNALLSRFEKLADGFEPLRPGIVHRLDKDTSGIVLAAKSNTAHAAIARLFERRAITKRYCAFCVGEQPLPSETITSFLGRNRRDPTKQAVQKRGRPAQTTLTCRAFRCGISLMDIEPKTGRTHQIRVHCSHRGFPVVQDKLYGGTRERIRLLDPAERPFAYGIIKCFDRQALHARELSFPHPFSGKPCRIVAPFPEDFLNAFHRFGVEEAS